MNTNEENNKTKESIEAVILDLDGVITETSKIHAKSWKKMFDEYNQKLTESGKQKFKPFSIEEDYYEYINGKPRYDGVRSFLKSRNIELPEGNPGDKPGENTVCGLGNHKNELFQKLLTEEGVTVYNDTVEKIKEWRNHGIKTAVVSSSKNCKKIVEMTGLSELFDVRVDGIILAELNLNGKPAPDTFLHAAKELNVPPSRAAVVEDAISGVQAGKSGRFKLVIGVARSGTANELLENGADIVVRTMAELRTLDKWNTPRIDPSHLADALQYGTEIEEQIKIKRLVVFLDYDGTLTPIVSRPEDAFLSADMRAVLENLASLCTVVIISGRDLKDVQNLVNINGLIYAGSHGFDISASGAINLTHQHEGGKAALPDLDEAESSLRKQLKDIPGSQVERKRFSVAVHYRNVEEARVQKIREITDAEINRRDHLKKGLGKKIIELQPDIDWHKGKAVQWILKKLDMNHPDTLTLYIGDDLTDENAFRSLSNSDVGILVGNHGEKTSANYSLRNVDEVKIFLNRLTQLLKG